VPNEILEHFGITELPNKYFALFIPPLVLTATTLFAFFIYPSLRFIMTPNMNSINTITDSSAVYRCKHKTNDEIVCDEKIIVHKLPWNNFGEWTCDKHDEHRASRIKNYCDCVEKDKCLLNNDKLYVDKLRKKQNEIQNASDLQIWNVSEVLYGE
jgi:hypothetical protein